MENVTKTSPLTDYLNRVSTQFYPSVRSKIMAATMCSDAAFCRWRKGALPTKANQIRINNVLKKTIFDIE